MKKPQPIIIHQLGVSGRVKETHMGVLIDGKPQILKGVHSLDELMKAIKHS